MIHITKTMKIVLISTLVAFAVCFLALGVSLAVDIIGNGNDAVDMGGSGGGGGGKPSSQQPSVPTGNVTPTAGNKTGIKLPSATPAGDYLGVSDSSSQDVSGDTDIKSGAIVLVDTVDGKVVAGKNWDERVYPASMTKVMTLLVACENAKDPNALLTVTQAMADEYKKPANQGASIANPWKAGDQVTVEDALHLVIYESDTFACWLLAEYVAGSEAQFVQLMNQKASSMGLTNTRFSNCTGLFNANHYTTCREMAAIMAAAMNNEAASAVLSRTSLYSVDVYTNGEMTGSVDMYSGWYTGRLEKYKLSGVAPYYVGGGSDIMLVGGKTGYEDVPRYCYVTAGQDDATGRTYVCVQVGRLTDGAEPVGEQQSTNDTRTIYRKYAKNKEPI